MAHEVLSHRSFHRVLILYMIMNYSVAHCP
jgi:hypothetical protein